MKEEWKEVKGFENYYIISNLGNIKRIEGSSHLKPKILNQTPDKDGYKRVNLKVKQKSNTKIVHRLLMETFIDNPLNKPQVNHINGIKSDNRLINLEWCTLSENRIHSYSNNLQNGINRQGVKNNFNKLKENEVLEIRNLYNKKLGFTYKFLSIKYNVSETCILHIIKKNNWKWLN